MSRESRPATGHWVGYLSDDGHAQWTRELRRTLTGDGVGRDAFAACWEWLCPAECDAIRQLSRQDCAELRPMLSPTWQAPARIMERFTRLACIAIPETLLRVLEVAEHFHVCFGTALKRLEDVG